LYQVPGTILHSQFLKFTGLLIIRHGQFWIIMDMTVLPLIAYLLKVIFILRDSSEFYYPAFEGNMSAAILGTQRLFARRGSFAGRAASWL